jgi:hypothetical protein
MCSGKHECFPEIFVVNTAFDLPDFIVSFGIQMWYSQTRFIQIIMKDGNRPVNNSLSFWKLLRSWMIYMMLKVLVARIIVVHDPINHQP